MRCGIMVVEVLGTMMMTLATGGRAVGQPPASAAAVAPAGALPAGPGHDTAVRVCSACHDPGVAAQQRLSPAGWHELVEQMAARGAVATDAEFAEITAYLSRAFPDPSILPQQ